MERESQKLTVEQLTERYQNSINKADWETKTPYWISTGFGNEFPSDMSCYDIGDLLRKAPGLITKGIVTDHEYSCCYFNFKTKRAADSFCKRLAKYLKKRNESVKQCKDQWGF